MRLPNSYGSVSKMKGNLRKPWRIVKTIEWTDGKQKRKTIGYARTKAEALQMLADYNEVPVDNAAFSKVYELFSKDITGARKQVYDRMYRRCVPLYDRPFKDITVSEVESFLNNLQCPDTELPKTKTMLNLLWDYGVKHDFAKRNCARLVSVKIAETKINREVFTDEEIKILWEHTDIPYVKTILCGIYSGFRPQELLTVKFASETVFVGGLKTEAGKNRQVPIHSKIKGILDFERSTYSGYIKAFTKIMEALHFKPHHPGDTRHTFATLCERFGVDGYSEKLLMGHTVTDVTFGVYTHKAIEDLRKEIEKITV